jgi:nitronate monooxygenase
MGTRIGAVARWLFRHRRTKKWMRAWYAIRTGRLLKRTLFAAEGAKPADTAIWQAGMSVAGIDRIEPVHDIVTRFVERAESA